MLRTKGAERAVVEDGAAQADAAAMAAEQACCILEHKYISLSDNFSVLQSQNSQLNATLEERLAELSQLREENHKAQLSSILKDEENERLLAGASELRESKRQLMELVEQKDMEMSEKNVTIKSHLDRIVNLTKDAVLKEARLCDVESEVSRTQASYKRVSQEKELVERHNSYLNDELNAKADDLIKLRRAYSELEAEMSAKLLDGEKRWNESCSALKWNKDRAVEMESKLESLQKEFMAAKDAAASSDKQLYSEITTLEKLVELYKESSEEWSKKAGELEGVVKALETHVSQVEHDSKERLEKEVSARMEIEKEANGLKENLKNSRKTDELWMNSSEQAEYKRAVETCSELDQKLKDCLSDQTDLQRHILELKVELRRKDRETDLAQKMNVDLQNQAAVLLKECRDIQLRCGIKPDDLDDLLMDTKDSTLNYKDISGLVEQNVQLRQLVSGLSEDIVSQEMTLKEKYEMKKHMDEASVKVRTVLARAEEQQQKIESLQASVAMYKKLYEEESLKSRSLAEEALTGKGKLDSSNVVDDSNEKARERVKYLEEELSKSRSEIISLRSEVDKLGLQVRWSQEKLETSSKEIDHQRDKHNGLIAKNAELSQLVTDCQRKMQAHLESLKSAEEISRKLTLEVSLLKQEKEILLSSEKRASDEVCSLSERVHRMQASKDAFQSTEKDKEEGRIAKKRKLESYVEKIEKQWEEAKRDLQDERNKVRHLTLEREKGVKSSLKHAEELRKAVVDLAAAEAKAFVAEARCSQLEEKMKSIQAEFSNQDGNEDFARDENEKLVEEAQISRDHMLQYRSMAQSNEEAFKQLEAAYEKSKAEDDGVKKSLEADVLSLRETVDELQGNLDLKIKEVAGVYAAKEEAAATCFSEISGLRESCSAKMSEIVVLQTQIASLKDDLKTECNKSSAAQAKYERQVSLHSDAIQELYKASQGLNELQEEASELRRSTAALENENNELKVKLETEETMLEVLKNDLDKKYDEVSELNKILHNYGGVGGSSSQGSLPEDDGLQSVVKYLRRSKENSEAELCSLKQEKVRLQSQLETAKKAAETAQASGRNSKSLFFSEEDFQSLQLQVQEISLLRESNTKLREENRQNFDECQKLRESWGISRAETESLIRSLGEKQNEVEVCRREIEIHMKGREDAQKKVDELLERSKNVDAQESNRMKDVVQQLQAITKEEEEKDARIQSLERTLEMSREKSRKYKDELEMEKERRVKLEKTVEEIVSQQPDKSRADVEMSGLEGSDNNTEAQENISRKRSSMCSSEVCEETAEPSAKKSKHSEFCDVLEDSIEVFPASLKESCVDAEHDNGKQTDDKGDEIATGCVEQDIEQHAADGEMVSDGELQLENVTEVTPRVEDDDSSNQAATEVGELGDTPQQPVDDEKKDDRGSETASAEAEGAQASPMNRSEAASAEGEGTRASPMNSTRPRRLTRTWFVEKKDDQGLIDNVVESEAASAEAEGAQASPMNRGPNIVNSTRGRSSRGRGKPNGRSNLQ